MHAPRRIIVLALAAVACLALPASASALAELRLGIVDPTVQNPSSDPIVLERLEDSGARLFRINLYWSSVAPDPVADARNPADPGYRWAELDQTVRNLKARGVEPIFMVFHAPPWAEGNSPSDRENRYGDPGSYNPNPGHLADFAHALATRYSGSFADPQGGVLPRVLYYQAWNEQNFGQYLTPRRRGDGPRQYVRMLNAFYDAVKAVSRRNFVIAGGLGPYGFNGHATDVDPQVFMREVLCVKGEPGGRNLRRKRCKASRLPKFDAWAQHPYVLGGTPRSKGRGPDAGAIGNIPQIRRTLDFASRAGHVRPRGLKPIWITEMGYFSDPPGHVYQGDQLGDPPALHAERLSETAYRLWRLRAPVFLWYAIRDQDTWPGGLYFAGSSPAEDRPKPALDAFRFPFYADRGKRGVLTWGLVQRGGRTQVAIERQKGETWVQVATDGTDARGMFRERLRTRKRGTYRARALDGMKQGLVSAPFRAR